MAGRKVLVFTEFADTARYLRAQLMEAGIDGLTQLDGGSKVDRAEIIRRFSPYYNGSSSGQLREEGQEEIRVLVSTDVLSGRPQPPGRHPVGQLRHPLEPGTAHAAHRTG